MFDTLASIFNTCRDMKLDSVRTLSALLGGDPAAYERSLRDGGYVYTKKQGGGMTPTDLK
ncbi:hypothetical protein E6Q11_05975 [Candidatus Dojkabacteria bacterium]|uniref:Uncharacterized protein n=1 Tax=Candidatus Dojkabacteria bacterium TaxID=2099670 RepID=A0A5C7J310_9BACT|nr:MAG: hypothetical protein E6Q11_05975 [Candidatus Dojkabacteria bacterium]